MCDAINTLSMENDCVATIAVSHDPVIPLSSVGLFCWVVNVSTFDKAIAPRQIMQSNRLFELLFAIDYRDYTDKSVHFALRSICAICG